MKIKLLSFMIGVAISGHSSLVLASIPSSASIDIKSQSSVEHAPTIEQFHVASLSDVAVQFSWNSSGKNNRYEVDIIERPANSSPIVYRADAIESGFYRGHLTPNTEYEAIVKVCNDNGCSSSESLTFTTQAERYTYNDARQADNHLSGNLAAHINLAQTHTSVTPDGNEDQARPFLIAERTALLLVTPKAYWTNHLWLEVLQDGVVVERVAMNPPSAQPETDQRDHGRETVVFSNHSWTTPISWQWMKPGISLRLSDNFNRVGELSEDRFIFGGAPELVIQNIDIGMLTEPRDQYRMIEEMHQLAPDYFQKIPASKLIMADYTPLHLTKVTLPNGKVYTERSDDEGGVYGGDMREAIGKALVSTGINNANFGIVDTAGYSQGWFRYTNHITAHNNRGVYQNGIVNHGLSGGGGKVTLSSSIGNEWSHELGHNYGRSHYPTNASVHDLTTGWGWDAFYNRFVGNLHWSGEATTISLGGQVVPPFEGIYRFTRDAQAGGESAGLGKVSLFTLEHPTQTQAIQRFFNDRPNIDLESPTGYLTWDHAAQRYVAAEVDHAAPIANGVPVITVLGIYDPMNLNPSQIYPLTYSNYGNVFELPEPSAIEPQLEGWQSVSDLNAEDRLVTEWQTMTIDGEQRSLCQFSYTNGNSEQANFVGYEDSNEGVCRTSADMYWSVNAQREHPVSQENDYQLLASKGSLIGAVTYTPTPELGEQTLCTLNKGGTSHDGAGFLADGRCKQVNGMKHTNGRDWTYATHQGGVVQYELKSQNQCQLNVTYPDGRIDEIALAGSRHTGNQSNKFHLNLDASQHPTDLNVTCRAGNGEVTILDHVQVERPSSVDKLMGPIIVGQEYGYSASQSGLPAGWFAHSDSFDPATLEQKDRATLVTMRKGNDREYVCRFETLVDETNKVLHGYVESLTEGQFQCTGGSEISIRDSQGERPMLSEINQFEWLSAINHSQVGERIKAKPGSDANLCSLTGNGEWYGVGYINQGGQCVQEPEVYWSNGNRWIFSSRHGQYTYR
ncbi:TagA-related protein [Vibrio ichthyoenteri ATCC 700023]|uniref:TagA-related protein n=1 Tax=Vibrio ichthyoenteri ATCC 700023 TaxID=870968 RepID=F9S817_9VIBR|nr:M66 family metalloprotease [Vibrio ichthyoenteri]EGU30494.1 TagA-related protein [Vibrio ichthyoenteri ATCC 700023]